MTILTSNICSAFTPNAIGTRVVDGDAFLNALETAVASYDASVDRVPGQHFVPMPEDTYCTVSTGVGKRSPDPQDYVIRVHRGQANLYLKREKAAPVETLAAIVYTREAYLNDPDVQRDAAEQERVSNSDASHVLVAVLASAGPKSPLTPDRFVKNLAGANCEALTWSTDEIHEKAMEIAAYYDAWHVVADPPPAD
jgi:hypothetical protein